MTSPLQIGFLVFPQITQLDFTGPLQVFSRVPGAKVHLIWKRIEPVPSDTVLAIMPTQALAECPQLDVICVPGGYGTDDLMVDDEVLAFLRKQAEGARYITSVCTGSTVLAAAGLLKGYRASTHWSAIGALSLLGAIPSHERVCMDGNRITGGGVTAGIDMALTLAARLVDQPTAEGIQLGIEYNPAPPFNAGSPETAPAAVRATLEEKMAPSQARRIEVAKLAAARLK
ncbi:MAG TPA: DJ-1/PfpI family protein [Hyphomicrobiaceae bacterium]|nr:DJ-1/PfpI family protein [Hyphomicrobiaceae bacterium]